MDPAVEYNDLKDADNWPSSQLPIDAADPSRDTFVFALSQKM
jgi:hypothetical protein